jgi:alcohol dehydrogenase class IV
MISTFNFAATPNLHFGVGKISMLPGIARSYGSKILLVTGKNSFKANARSIFEALGKYEFTTEQYVVDQEPTPSIIDSAVGKFGRAIPDLVVAIGGGSILDAGKAISAMLPLNEPVKYYLEGVGTKSHPGSKIPFIAIPTTSGTGSEATKNAVVSETGENGYKKSLRHNNFVPDVAIIDPELTVSCPASITAASGMDAFTQLLESYLSTMANPVTDALALQGLSCISRSLLKTYQDGNNLAARTDMALAAYLSGVTLANAGLGLVHGFASAIGGYYKIPHGVICSSLMNAANVLTVKKLNSSMQNQAALKKYATVGKLFSASADKSQSYYVDLLLETIRDLTSEMSIPKLASFDIKESSLERIVTASDNKYNPIALDQHEMTEVLRMSL